MSHRHQQQFLAWLQGSAPDVPAHVSCTFPWAREGAAARRLLQPFGIEVGGETCLRDTAAGERIDEASDIVGDLLVLATAELDDHFGGKVGALRRRAEKWVHDLDTFFRPHVASAIRAEVSRRLGIDSADDDQTLWRLLCKRAEEIMDLSDDDGVTSSDATWFGGGNTTAAAYLFT